MKKKFKFIILTIALSVISSMCFSFNCMAEENIKILINGKELQSADKAVIVDGRTLVPLRAIGEAMGCKVTWLNSAQTANLENETTKVAMKIGSTVVSKLKRVNTEVQSKIVIDVPPQLINDKTYIPLRAFAEALDAVVGWDGTSNTVMIVYDTTLKYAGNFTVETFAGNGERQKHDGVISNMSFISPEAVTVGANGEIYVADSGLVRKLSGGKSETVEFEPAYITANSVECYKNDVYVLTNEFQNTDGVKYYGIVRLNGSGAEGIFVTEANYSSISDFDISKDGKIYVLYNNVGVGQNYLAELDLSTSDINYIKEIDSGIKTLAVDDNGNVFLGNTVKGSIYFYNVNAGTLKLFAGVDDNNKFVDGPNPMFFEPRRMDYKNGYLYILDYNVVRRVSINSSNAAISSETIAGKISVEPNPTTNNGNASEVAFAPSYLMDIVATNDGILITDPKNAVVRIIK